MSDIESLLRQGFARHHDTVTVDVELFDRAVSRGVRRARRRRMALGGAAVIVTVAALALVSTMRGDDESDLAASGASAPRWSVAEITDPSVFDGDGDTIISQITPWRDQLIVLGVIQSTSGDSAAYAWVTDDGVDWERRRQDLPGGCGFFDGVVALSDRLVVTCKIHGTGPDGDGGRIGVAVTSDLESWTVTPVSETGLWFGSMIGGGPDGTVVVQALEADDPDTTLGSTMRIWSTSDLATWTRIEGQTPETLLDGQAASIRTFDDVVVVSGVVNDRVDQFAPDSPPSMRPAVWVSSAGAPFARTLLGFGDGSTSPSAAAMDVVSTDAGGYVAVGVAGDPASAVAWISPDLLGWSAVTVAPGLLWDVERLPDGTLLAAGAGPRGGGSDVEGWLSVDDGANWRSVGEGPDVLAVWNGRGVGMSGQSGSRPSFWTWG
jgi:hypothetical protein